MARAELGHARRRLDELELSIGEPVSWLGSQDASAASALARARDLVSEAKRILDDAYAASP